MRESREEDQRLLYVAMTRAKARLYLPYFGFSSGVGTSDGQTREFMQLAGAYEQLNGALDDIVESPDASRLFSKEVIREAEPSLKTEAEKSTTELTSWHIPPDTAAIEKSDFARMRRERGGFIITSYSRIKASKGGYKSPQFSLPDDDGAQEFGVNTAIEHSEDELPGGAAAGRFLHEILEKVPLDPVKDFEHWRADPRVEEIFLEALKNHDQIPQYLEHSQRLVYQALTTELILGDRRIEGGMLNAERVLREMEFLYPIPEPAHPPLGQLEADEGLHIERGFVKGFIDVIFEHEGKTYVVDWKSDLLPSYDCSALTAHVEQNYVLQADLYTLALVKMLELYSPEEFESRFGGTAYLFIRGMGDDNAPSAGIFFKRPTFEEVLASEESLRSTNVGETT